MEKITITHLHGTYYTLYDCYGEIETSKNLMYLKELYNAFNTDNELKNEMYGGADMQLHIEKETYDNGRIIDSEVIISDISNL